ncbi:MAG: acetyl-CoA carboxylase biotin carboxyl carrier protein subunit [Desulfobacterales bacterium]|nr:acetyl-CoA carboxylase biotin carboxyl carrier protein subunit [Desulfobacterales bacterium]
MSQIKAPMPGKIIDLKVREGDTVSEGDTVVVLEAMKMEMPIIAKFSGIVRKINCKIADAVARDAVLIVIE